MGEVPGLEQPFHIMINAKHILNLSIFQIIFILETDNRQEIEDYMLSTVSETAGGASSLGHQLNVTYNITMQNAKECMVILGDNQLESDERPFMGKIKLFVTNYLLVQWL